MKAVHNRTQPNLVGIELVIAHVKLQNESSSQPEDYIIQGGKTCDCSRKITK